jgi:hypothetical protein
MSVFGIFDGWSGDFDEWADILDWDKMSSITN